MRYLVTHRYGSSTYGPWAEGDHIELDPTEAEWVNHDSPGTLEKVDAEKQARDKRERHEAEEQARADARATKAEAEKSDEQAADEKPTSTRRAPARKTTSK